VPPAFEATHPLYQNNWSLASPFDKISKLFIFAASSYRSHTAVAGQLIKFESIETECCKLMLAG